MPSVFRFLTIVGLIGAVGYGALYWLAHSIEPTPREMTVTIPPDRMIKQR